jgi:hypothetical protein
VKAAAAEHNDHSTPEASPHRLAPRLTNQPSVSTASLISLGRAAKAGNAGRGATRLNVAGLLELQRSAGNRATAALVRSSAPIVVQRDVGLEFQCRNWTVYDDKGEKVESQKGISHRIYPTETDKGYYIMSDGGDPEFVIEHVPETDQGRVQLDRRVKMAMNFAASFMQKTRIDTKTGKKSITVMNGKKKSHIRGTEDTVTADPQVTGGVRLDQVPALFELLSRRDPMNAANDSEANKSLARNKAATHYKGDDLLLGKTRQAVYSDLQDPGTAKFLTELGITPTPIGANVTSPYEALAGFIMLLASYLIKAPELGHAYIKDFPVLSKSTLIKAQQLSPLGRNVPGSPQRPAGPWTDDELEQIMGIVVGSAKRTSADELIYDPKTTGPSAKPDEDGPTIKQWLLPLLKGQTDQLSYLNNRSFTDNSMGPLNKTDTVGTNIQAPILELRRINQTMPSNEWVDFGKNIFDFIRNLNKGKSKDFREQ